MDIQLVAPEIVGDCDPDLVTAARCALAQRAAIAFIFEEEHSKGLPEIERTIALAQQDCEFRASRAFMLRELGKR